MGEPETEGAPTQPARDHNPLGGQSWMAGDASESSGSDADDVEDSADALAARAGLLRSPDGAYTHAPAVPGLLRPSPAGRREGVPAAMRAMLGMRQQGSSLRRVQM